MFGIDNYLPIFQDDFDTRVKNINTDVLAILAKHQIDVNDVIDRKYGFVSYNRLNKHVNYDNLSVEDKKIIIENSIKIEKELILSYKEFKKIFDIECNNTLIKEIIFSNFRTQTDFFDILIESSSNNISFLKKEIKNIK